MHPDQLCLICVLTKVPSKASKQRKNDPFDPVYVYVPQRTHRLNRHFKVGIRISCIRTTQSTSTMHPKQLWLLYVLIKVPSKTSNRRKNVIFGHTHSFSTQDTGSGFFISETVGNHDLSTLKKTFRHASQTTLPHMCPYISHLQDPQPSKKPSFLTPPNTPIFDPKNK